jgi:hypothetical protein
MICDANRRFGDGNCPLNWNKQTPMSPASLTLVYMMKIRLADIGGSNVLAQAAGGRAVLRKLLAITDAEPDRPEPVFLDFHDVEVATSSFLRESVLGFRDATRTRRSNFYPVISGANATVKEELLDMLRLRGEAMLSCNLSSTGSPRDVELLGALDPKYRQTFDLVARRGETDAGTLMRESGEDDTVSRTAWNNRLATLAGLGLVVEISQGRAKRYKPVLEKV